MKVLLDSNFLMIPGQFGVDIFSELDRILDFKYEVVTLQPVVEELERIADGESRDAEAAGLGLDLLEDRDVRVLEKETHNVDKAILDEARAGDTIVCTQDKPLRDSIRDMDLPVIVLRSKSHLELVGYPGR